MLRHTTPVPNNFFDEQMKNLSSVAIRGYLKICRNTNGWRDKNGKMKQRDWISHSQFSEVGISSRSVTKAVNELLSKNMIVVSDERGRLLNNPNARRFARRIFYGLNQNNNEQIADYTANNSDINAKTGNTPPQILPTTKEILQKSSTQNLRPDQRQTDRQRLEQLLAQEHRKQHNERDNWI